MEFQEIELIESTGLNKIKSKLLLSAILKLLKLDKVDQVYRSSSDKQGVEFIDDILSQLNIDIEFNEDELNNIPKNLPFILF